MTKPHYEVVCAVIRKDNLVFCCRRKGEGECAYKWEFPGGKIEPNETKEEALHREIKEELDCSITINNYLTTINHEYNTFKVTLHVYLCSLISKEPSLKVHKEAIWISVKELKNLDFLEADYMFLDMIK